MSGHDRPAELRAAVAGTLLPGFTGTALPDWLAQRLRDGLGGVCLFGVNIESPSQLAALTASILDANPDAVLAIDEEGGDVTRLHYDKGAPFPGNAVLGRIDDEVRTESVARRVGVELRAAGCTLTFAPDADINSDPRNPVIGVRSFGDDAGLVARHTAAWTRGLQSTGVAVSAKHFPGHGDTAHDSHLALPVVDRSLEQLRERELVPFAAAVAAGARTVMTSHILLPRIDPGNPATFSRGILQGILREELGFDGVIVSDALDMVGASGEIGMPEAAVRALAAGCELLCLGLDNTPEQLRRIEDHVLDAIGQGRLDASTVQDAAAHVRSLARELAAQRQSIPIGEYSDGDASHVLGAGPAGNDFDAVALSDAFETNDAARAWIASPPRDVVVVRIDTVASIAIGAVPWGPFAAASAADGPWSPGRVVGFAEGMPLSALAIDPSTAVIVVGRDIHRHAFVCEAIDLLRAGGRAVLVVEMGWPSPDRSYADLATFGASRLIGETLLAVLGSAEGPPGAQSTTAQPTTAQATTAQPTTAQPTTAQGEAR